MRHIPFAGIFGKDYRSPLHASGAVFRAFLGGNAVFTSYADLTRGAVLRHSSEILIWALLVAGVLVVVDAVVNDALPERCHWSWAREHRHFLLAAMACGYLAQLYVLFSIRVTALPLLLCTWNACSLMAIAFIDAHQRSKDAACLRTPA